MIIKQLSVFLENRSGRLTEVTGALAESHINIAAQCVAEASDFGILRMIVSDPTLARSVLNCVIAASTAVSAVPAPAVVEMSVPVVAPV